MSDDLPWARLPADWRTQVLSVGTWTADEVLDLIEEWQHASPAGSQRFDATAFEAFVQEQADIVMALLDEGLATLDLERFMSRSAADHQRDAVVVALRRAYPQPHALDEIDAWMAEMAEETAEAEQEADGRRCEFCGQDELVARLRGQYRTLLGHSIRHRRERYGLFFRAES